MYKYLLMIFFIILTLPALSLNDRAIKAEADYITFSPDKTIFVADGNVKVSLKDLDIEGGTICVDVTNSHLVASNNVLLTSETGTYSCDSISINLNDKKAYVFKSQEQLKAQFDMETFQPLQGITEFPEGTFYIDNILNSDVCVTGKELVIHPNETAQIKPASFWIQGNQSMELPFYSFTLGTGSSYVRPRVAYTNLGATVDIPVIVSLQENSMSLAHLKYNGDLGATISMEHQMRFSDKASVVFYMEDLNNSDYRRARMVYRHQLTPKTDVNLNLDWQNDKDLDMFFNLSHRFSNSIVTCTFTAEKSSDFNREAVPPAFDLQWKQNPTPLLGSPLIYAFSGGLSMAGQYYDKEAIWNRTVGLRLTHKPLMIGETSSLVFGIGDEISWYTSSLHFNHLFSTMSLRLGSRVSLDANVNIDSSSFNNGGFIDNTNGNISLNTRFTDEFSGRFTYYFSNYNAQKVPSYYSAIDNYYYLNNQLGAFFTYNKSQNFQIGLGATYDMINGKIGTAQGNMRFKIGKYVFLTLRPYYDFINNTNNFNFQIDPVITQ